MNYNRGKRISHCLAAIGIISFVTYLNYLTPLFADDFSYSVSWVTKEPMSSLMEVLESQYLHYYTTNGRSVVHTLAQILLIYGKPLLNLINGIAFYTFCVLICFHGCGSFKRIEAWHIVVVFAMLWFITPHFGGSYLWVMGAVNYLYSPQIILLFLIPYRLYLNDVEVKNNRNIWKAVILFAFGVLAGWTNENTSLALLFMVMLTIGYGILCKKKVAPWMYTGFVGSIIGCMLLFFSPAQSKRLNSAGGFGTISVWIERFLNISFCVLKYLWIPLVLLAVCLIIYIRSRKSNGLFRNRLAAVLVFLGGTGISIYSMVGSPEFPIWVWSSILAFALICLGNAFDLLTNVEQHLEKKKVFLLSMGLILAIICSCFKILPELHRIKNQYDIREEQIQKASEKQEVLYVELIKTNSKYSSYSLFDELSSNPDNWPNTAIANYYDLPAIAAGIEKENENING